MVLRVLSFLALLMAPFLAAQDSSPDALFQAGVNNLAARKFEEAEAAFRSLRSLEPGNVRGLVGVAQTLMARSRNGEALQYVATEISKDPLNPKLNLVMGDLAAQAGQYEIAAVRFVRALDLLATDPNAATFFVKRSTKRGPDAAADPFAAALDNFIGHDPTPAGPGGILIRQAEAYLRMGDGPRGVDALENARRFLPANPDVLQNLAVLYEVARNRPKAAGVYRDLLKVRPDDVSVLNNLAFLLADTGGDLNEALRYALRARDLQPKAVEVTDTLGWVYLKRRAFTEAIPLLAQTVQALPGNGGYRDHLRLALEQSGDQSEAVMRLVNALQEPPADLSNRALSEMLARMYPPK